MAKEFFNRDMEFFLDHRVDWARYFAPGSAARTRTGATRSRPTRWCCAPPARSASRSRTGARDHWHEHAVLQDGEVVVPPHIAAGYAAAPCRRPGVAAARARRTAAIGLPCLINNAYLEMVARADSSLMTIVGLQAGVAHDIESYGSDEIKQRYLPGFASGTVPGLHGPDRAGGGIGPGRHHRRARPREGDHYIVDGEKIFITNGGADVHLVLARDAATYDQSRGTTNGLSLILCPKILPDGRRNGIRVTRAGVQARHPRLAHLRGRARARRGLPARRRRARDSAPCSN